MLPGSLSLKEMTVSPLPRPLCILAPASQGPRKGTCPQVCLIPAAGLPRALRAACPGESGVSLRRAGGSGWLVLLAAG